MRRSTGLSLLAAAVLAIACGPVDNSVDVHPGTAETDPPTEQSSGSTAATEAPGTTPETAPPALVQPALALEDVPVVRLAGDKPSQPHDTVVAAAITDLEQFWRGRYPDISGGDEYPELAGGVWPVWSGSGDVPGCGTPVTTYVDVEGNAFYCFDDDFMAYDDENLFPGLAEEFGELTVGLVLAHEWGHAIQARVGYRLAPVVYELQADCFAGAWIAFLRDGDGLLGVSNESLRGALGGIVLFKDDPGTTSQSEGAHGSAFDRLSAFQDGLDGGVGACHAYQDDPPDPLQLPWSDLDEEATQGNMPYDDLLAVDPADDEEGTISLPESLDEFWTATALARGSEFDRLAQALVRLGDAGATCSDDVGDELADGVAYCRPEDSVLFDEAVTRRLHEQIGDFSLGVLFGEAWAQAGEDDLGVDADDDRQTSDCLTGVYVSSIFPGRQGSAFAISPGDLDEAVSMYLLLTEGGEQSAAEALRRIGSFRVGLLAGLQDGVDQAVDACLA